MTAAGASASGGARRRRVPVPVLRQLDVITTIPSLSAVLAAAGDLPAQGGYFSLFKWIVMALMVIAWLAICQWVDKDCMRLHLRRFTWNGVIVGSGALGVLLWLVIPWFFIGLLAFAITAFGAGYTYVYLRNPLVSPNSRVLTGEHMARLFSRRSREPESVPESIHLLRPGAGTRGSDLEIPPLASEDPLYEGYVTGQEVLLTAIERRAERLTLLPAGQAIALQYTTDGVTSEPQQLERRVGELVIAYVKQSAGLDVADRRRPQEGMLKVQEPSRRLTITVKTSGSRAGESLVVLIENLAERLTLETLGMTERQQEALKEFRRSEGGVLITGAAAAAGSTTSFYHMLRAHDAFMTNIQTLEQQPEADLENITQHHYEANDSDESVSFARAMQSIVRRGPDVVGVSLCKDKETAQLIAQSALEHTKYYVQMAGKDTFTLLARWAALVGDLKLAMAPLRLIFAQTLVRKICPECREAYRPDPELLRKLNLPADRIERLYRPPSKPLVDEKGNPVVCPKCQGTGYCGRTGIYETLVIDDELRRLVVSNAPASEIKQYCRSQKMLYLQEEALRKVMAGETSINEVLRVFRESK
ncbi:MAG: hypothetical protein BIFFINMI_02085 [Phycisphaerae bacterium]|nr:hypothetical protein [Phycisphaerae bacterium]